MYKIFGLTLEEWAAATVLFTFFFGGCAGLIRYFRKIISEPLRTSIDELREDFSESRDSRKRNEKKLFDTTDEHTKQIYSLDGRVKTLETINQIEKEDK